MKICVCGEASFVRPRSYNTSWGPVRLARCRRCGLTRDLLEHPNSRLYDDEAGIYKPPTEDEFVKDVRAMSRYIDFLKENRVPNRSALDVGCNAGYLVQALLDAGWRATGLEIT